MFGALSLEELRRYEPRRDEPTDFDQFWRDTLTEARAAAVDATFTPVSTYLKTIETLDVSFRGFGGQWVRAWLNVPRVRSGPLPCVVEYVGYYTGRGAPHKRLSWSSAGYAHLIMDNRGQTGAAGAGDTADVEHDGSAHFPGFLTTGLDSPDHSYFRRLYVDGVRAVEAARASPLVDPGRIAVAGHCFGGAVCVAVSALAPDVQAVLPSLPGLCNFRRAIEFRMAMPTPYDELVQYLATNPADAESTLRTLDYFDGLNFAPRATAPALFAVSLMDELFSPANAFAVYNHYRGDKDIRVWEFHTHESYSHHHQPEQLAFVADIFPSGR